MIATMIGKTFQFLTVLRFAGRKRWYPYVWCRCVCGSDYLVAAYHVKRGGIQSCGCRRKELIGLGNTDHGCSSKCGVQRRVYRSWRAMLWRCNPRNSLDRDDYNGRGITVCEQWRGPRGFITFWHDMGDPPNGTSIERIDNNGNYTPTNCRWATQVEQCSNQRSNWHVVLDGEKMTVAAATRKLGLKHTRVYKELYRRNISKLDCVSLNDLVPHLTTHL